jgi:hypothetical protein
MSQMLPSPGSAPLVDQVGDQCDPKLNAAGSEGHVDGVSGLVPAVSGRHVRFELRNVVANYPFESSRGFPGSELNSGHGDHSCLSCGGNPAAIEAEIAHLRSLALDALRRHWRVIFGQTPPVDQRRQAGHFGDRIEQRP